MEKGFWYNAFIFYIKRLERIYVCVAIEKEHVVAGYVNQHSDGLEFTIQQVNEYIMSLWNAGCGPIRLNFTQQELVDYLDSCRGICLSITQPGYVIDKSGLSFVMTPEERSFLHNDTRLAQSFALFCKLQVDLKTPDRLLDAMGFRFIYA